MGNEGVAVRVSEGGSPGVVAGVSFRSGSAARVSSAEVSSVLMSNVMCAGGSSVVRMVSASMIGVGAARSKSPAVGRELIGGGGSLSRESYSVSVSVGTLGGSVRARPCREYGVSTAVDILSSPASLFMCLIMSDMWGTATKWLADTIVCLSIVKKLHVPVPFGICATPMAATVYGPCM